MFFKPNFSNQQHTFHLVIQVLGYTISRTFRVRRHKFSKYYALFCIWIVGLSYS